VKAFRTKGFRIVEYKVTPTTFHYILNAGSAIRVASEKEALALSVEKWQLVVKFLREKPGSCLDSGGASTCALCMMHSDECVRMGKDKRTRTLTRCPVYRASGCDQCRCTPYMRAWNSVEWAEREVRFLQALAPDRKRQPKAVKLLEAWGMIEKGTRG
jgi:hypothetical protein